MAEPIIIPSMPAVGSHSEAFAGASGVVFTATDRRIIKDRAGDLDTNKTFIDVIKDGPLIPIVENEETTIRPEQDIPALESRQKEHERMLKYSTISVPREHVEITLKEPPKDEPHLEPPFVTISGEANQPIVDAENVEKVDIGEKEIHQKTAEIIKELNLNPAELFDKFALEQDELHALIFKIKELHFKRFLSANQADFEKLSIEIEKETLASGKPEAKQWLERQLKHLTQSAVEYKFKLLKSLQAMEYDAEREKNLHWLEKTISQSA